MKMLIIRFGFVVLFFLMLSCSSKVIDYAELNSFDDHNHLQAVIEIPVGSTANIEYNSIKNKFEQDTINGQPRYINFLAYPVNYGFIPSTNMDNDKEGVADPLDVLVLGQTLKTGQIISVKPVGILWMKNNGKLDHKVLSIPVDENLQTINIKNFKDLSQKHFKIREMIGEWFQYYDKSSNIEILGWSDEQMARDEVRKWQTLKSN